MGDMKRDTLFKPRNSRPWKHRYLLLKRVADDPYKRTADRTFHGVEGGCFAARGDHSPDNYAFTEAMIYTADDGLYWIADPSATTNQLDGWRTIEACQVCGLIELDKIIAERLAWQALGRCYRTYHPGFFATKDGDGVGGKRKQERLEALQMCNGNPQRGFAPCSVRDRCLKWSRRLHEVQAVIGILGGEDEEDRRALFRATRSA